MEAARRRDALRTGHANHLLVAFTWPRGWGRRWRCGAEILGFAVVSLPLVAVAVSLGASIVGLRRTVRTDPALAFS